MSDAFDDLQAALESGGPEAALDRLVEQLQGDNRPHELFNARLMQARRKLGLPLVSSQSLDETEEPLRSKLESAYLDACREVGGLLLAEGKFRDAWMYLRLVGDKSGIAAALECAEPDDEQLDELVEVALHEGVSPARGFGWVLDHYGTCNAITTFEGVMPHQPPGEQEKAAGMLIRRLHGELLENVRSHIENREPPPADATLAELVAANEWIFEGDNYHIDTSHLASTVRFARLAAEPELVELAFELTEYGRRLGEQLQYSGEEPFVDLYPAHGLLFAASLGRQVDEALAYFHTRAKEVSAQDEGTASIETYLILLSRLNRHAEALEAFAELVPVGAQLSTYAPQMHELAAAAGSYDRYLELCRERGELLAFAAGLAASGG
jgi:hypothetical protein